LKGVSFAVLHKKKKVLHKTLLAVAADCSVRGRELQLIACREQASFFFPIFFFLKNRKN
jgi:hypothetical protein